MSSLGVFRAPLQYVFFVVLLTGVGLANCARSPLSKKTSLRDEYDLINMNLIQSLQDDDDPEKNLLEAMRWFEMATGKTNDGHRPAHMPSKESLFLFTSLLPLLDAENPICDLVSLKILQDNEKAIGRTIAMPVDQLGPMRRIDDIIHRVGLIHANICRDSYLHKLNAVTNDRNDEGRKLESVKMLNEIIKTSRARLLRGSSPSDLESKSILTKMAAEITVTSPDAIHALLQYLHQAAKDDNKRNRLLRPVGNPDQRNKWIIKENIVKELIREHVFDLCEHVLHTYGPVLAPAKYDQQFFRDDERYESDNDANSEIMLWLQYYRLCQEMLDNRKIIISRLMVEIWLTNFKPARQ